MYIEVELEVAVRKYEVDVNGLQKVLKEHKCYSNQQIADALGKPKTEVDHWFRTDKYFSPPEPEVWFKLKELLGIENVEFDKSLTEFEYKGGNYDCRNRIHIGEVSPTLTVETNGYHLLGGYE